jgi:hypothetical protein
MIHAESMQAPRCAGLGAVCASEQVHHPIAGDQIVSTYRDGTNVRPSRQIKGGRLTLNRRSCHCGDAIGCGFGQHILDRDRI